MKKSIFFIFIAFLFVVSCSNGDDPLIPCVTVSDCPDSSYSCLDSYCVHNGANIDPTASDDSSDTLPDSGENDGGDTSDDAEIQDDPDDNDLPEPVSNDDDDTPAVSDEDGEDNDDNDGNDDNDDNEDEDSGDDTDTENADDSDTSDDADTIPEQCKSNEDCLSNPNNIRCDTSTGKCVMCLSDSDCLAAYGQSCDLTTHQCVSDKTCAAAIEKLPHGGKFDWEDGTTQGFSTNNYWDVVSASLLPAESTSALINGGAFSFGQYSTYSSSKDYISVLDSDLGSDGIQSADLSLCSACKVNVNFYARGAIPKLENGKDFLHPTCNGNGTTTAGNSTAMTPQSPWEYTDGFAGNIINSYSETLWTKLDWELPSSCKTDKFVFGLRFRSDSSVEGKGLVVDDLSIAPIATEHEPNGVFESADGGNIKGWTCDLDAVQKYILVKIEYYKNKDESAAAAVRWAYAKLQRPGDSAVLSGCSETNNHGFEMPFDEELRAVLGNGTHSAAVFAVDIPATETSCSGIYKKLGDTKEFVVAESE